MNGDGRWWWLEMGQEHARCRAERADKTQPGRCKNKSRVNGLCRTHARLADNVVIDTPKDVLIRMRSQSFRHYVRGYMPPGCGSVGDLALDTAIRKLEAILQEQSGTKRARRTSRA